MSGQITRRLKHVADINQRSLDEHTDPDAIIRYLDISAVGRGVLASEPETMRFADAPSRARRLVSARDTIVSTVRTYLRAVWPVRGEVDDLVVSTGFVVLSPRQALKAQFFAWVVQSDLFIEEVVARSVGVSYPAINPSDVGNIRVPVPPLGEQRAIADFLDRETARIDALITAKHRMIDVLDEQARSWSVVNVLGDGLAGAGPSPSGFYGGVPGGWRETALRHLGCEVQTGPFGSQLHADEYVEGGWPVVNPMNLVDGGIVATNTMTVSDSKRAELDRHVLRPGDIVFGRRGEMGRAGLATSEHEGWLCGTGSLRVRLVGQLLMPEYLKLLLSSPPARAYFELSSVGSTMDNLNSEIVLAFPALVPPLKEQAAIVSEIARHGELMGRSTSTLLQQIDLLVEHRQALITAAVTGELDVGVAA